MLSEFFPNSFRTLSEFFPVSCTMTASACECDGCNALCIYISWVELAKALEDRQVAFSACNIPNSFRTLSEFFPNSFRMFSELHPHSFRILSEFFPTSCTMIASACDGG